MVGHAMLDKLHRPFVAHLVKAFELLCVLHLVRYLVEQLGRAIVNAMRRLRKRDAKTGQNHLCGVTRRVPDSSCRM
jgi:hypothetical protein